MPITSKIREQIISTFKIEVAEHMQTISNGLLVLEKHLQKPEDRQALIQEVFRSAHSMKGAARSVGVTAVEQLAHGLENVLSDIQKGRIDPSANLYTACYRTLDAIQVVETAYEAGETTPPMQALQALTTLETLRAAEQISPPEPSADPEMLLPQRENSPTSPAVQSPAVEYDPLINPGKPSSPAPVPSTLTDETIRVRVEKLDSVINQLGDLLMAKIRLDQRLVQINQLQSAAAQLQQEWASMQDPYTPKGNLRKGEPHQNAAREGTNGSSELLSSLPAQTLVKEINKKVNELARDYSSDILHISMAIDALEKEVKQIRLLPLSTITGAFERMIRDLATAAGKEVVYEITGAEVEMDKRVLELVKDPLIHLLRNAVDHGIETATERRRLNKPAAGKITLSAEHQGKDVVLRVADDGNGLNMEAIRKAVAHHHGNGAGGQELSELELTGWIFNNGFSTNPIITDVSGRGIGLDVVRKNVEALQGRIDVRSVPGEGAVFILTIPMALTSSHVLLVRASSQTFAFPLSAVVRILSIKPDTIFTVGGEQVLRENGQPVPLVSLKSILGLPAKEQTAPAGGQSQAVILSAAGQRTAFLVDDLIGEQEIVIKGLGKQLTRVGGIAGAAVLGNGQVVLVLNVADLIKIAARADARGSGAFHPVITQKKQKKLQKRILVVDDSITTRTLEKNILEAEGFIVQVATNGQEALGIIASSRLPDLIISDINMPYIDGFELTTRVKSDPRTKAVPVFLVSSLDSAEDKAHGIQVGADAYIVKSRFDQTNLLDLIQQVIG